jgi:hypothetical protein
MSLDFSTLNGASRLLMEADLKPLQGGMVPGHRVCRLGPGPLPACRWDRDAHRGVATMHGQSPGGRLLG